MTRSLVLRKKQRAIRLEFVCNQRYDLFAVLDRRNVAPALLPREQQKFLYSKGKPLENLTIRSCNISGDIIDVKCLISLESHISALLFLFSVLILLVTQITQLRFQVTHVSSVHKILLKSSMVNERWFSAHFSVDSYALHLEEGLGYAR